MMKELTIHNSDQVKRINQLASDAPYEVWLSTDVVMLDARSLLGLYTLVGQKVHVIAEDDVDPKRFAKLVSKMDQ